MGMLLGELGPPEERVLPKDVLAVLPADPHEQLLLAHRITCHAFSQKVSALEGEVGNLRRSVADKSKQVRVLETRLTTCQLELQDSQDKARHHAAVGERLVAEKQALVGNVRRLTRDLAKLDAFKRNLLHSLQSADEAGDESGSNLLAELTLDPPSPARGKRDPLGGVSRPAAAIPQDLPPQQLYSPIKPASHSQAPRSPQSTNNRHRLRPVAPQQQQQRPAGPDEPEASPHPRKRPPSQTSSYRRSPPKEEEEDEYEDENEPAASNAPGPGGRGARGGSAAQSSRPLSGASADRLDGKEFFRKARARLSGGTFSQFLETIKDLNSGQATREEALKWARDIFGPANYDLYSAFEGLLSRHLPAVV